MADQSVNKSMLIMPVIVNHKKIGFSFCLIDNDDLFFPMINASSKYAFEIYENNKLDKKNIVFTSRNIAGSIIEKRSDINVGNHFYSVIWKRTKNSLLTNASSTSVYMLLMSLFNALIISFLINIKIQRELALEKNIQLQSKITDSEKRYYSIFTASSDGIVIFKGIEVIEFNHRFKEMFGLTSDKKFENFNIRHLFPTMQNENLSSEDFINSNFNKMQNLDHLQLEAKCIKNGLAFNVEIKVDKFKLDNEDYYIGTFIDITDRKLIEERLIEAHDYALTASRAKSRFLSNMSHEIRTPLNGIIGLINILLIGEDNKNLTQSQIENLKVAEFSANHLIHILNEILDFNKIESGKLTLEKRVSKLKDFANKIIKIHETASSKKNLELVLEYDENIPTYLILDELRNGQIINNLLSNSIKFTGSGKVILKIKLIGIENNKANIEFSVIDSGIGIPKNKIDYIFNEFTQANEEHSRKYGGTGLGLSISKKLIELQGGDIIVHSQVDSGTTMSYSIDFEIADEDKFLKQQSKEEINSQINFKGIEILLVEDNEVNILVAKKYLEKWEAKVTIAHDGLECLKILETNYRPHLILMDFHMPNMDGITATSEIRKFNQDIPVIGLSADVTTDLHSDLKKYQMNDFISKPFKARDLAIIIKKYIA